MSEGALPKQLNAIKHSAFPWMLEVTKRAPQLAIKDLGKAFQNFFAKRAEFPAFKKKGRHDYFSISNDTSSITNKTIRIPKLGCVRTAEHLRLTGKILGAVVSRRADQWFVSVQVQTPDPEPVHNGRSPAVGVDLGIKNLVTLSDGTKAPGAKPYGALLSRVRRLNQSLSRKVGSKKGQKKSQNFKKVQKKLARLHARIANIRNDQTQADNHAGG